MNTAYASQTTAKLLEDYEALKALARMGKLTESAADRAYVIRAILKSRKAL
jgi:hypothetical protein